MFLFITWRMNLRGWETWVLASMLDAGVVSALILIVGALR